ncbi:MAG: YbbR-like domain-containing protein [Acidobacteria bacterium]|nr:YbbR-like domain-containing protein [Acidobacteriota bacterium]
MELRGLLFDNLGLKLVSLLLALLLWFSVSSEQVYERTVSVPVEFLNIPASLEISNDYTRTLDVQITARRGGLFSSGNVAMSAQVNLQDAGVGERIVPITEADIRKPDTVVVLNITPSRIALVLERTSTKLVPVDPQIVGTPAPGYQVMRVQAIPPEITVTGPESRVRRAVKAVTEPIEISGAKSSVQRDVNVDVAESKLRVDRIHPVRVGVLIEEERVSETVVVPLSVDPGLRAAVRTVQLQVSYPKARPVPLTPSMFSVRLQKPADAVAGEERDLAPQVSLNRQAPDTVRVERVTPDRIKVRIG